MGLKGLGCFFWGAASDCLRSSSSTSCPSSENQRSSKVPSTRFRMSSCPCRPQREPSSTPSSARPSVLPLLRRLLARRGWRRQRGRISASAVSVFSLFLYLWLLPSLPMAFAFLTLPGIEPAYLNFQVHTLIHSAKPAYASIGCGGIWAQFSPGPCPCPCPCPDHPFCQMSFA